MAAALKDLPDKTFLTPSEVARFLSIHIATVYRWCDEGKLVSVKMHGIIRVDRESIIKLLKNPPEN
jgi:excisionase family DNA binding protein